MFAEGLRNVVVGVSAIGTTRGMDRGCEVAVRALQPISRSVKDKSDTAHIATVSAHNDAEIGALLADSVEQVGSEGVVEVEEARGTETTLEVVEGMQLTKVTCRPTSSLNAKAMEAVLENPLVLLVDRKISATAKASCWQRAW